MQITTSCPTRIDLAGGTLDIYPLYLFEEQGLTINAAINLRSKVKLQSLPGAKVILQSLDLKQTVKAIELKALNFGNNLDFLIRALKFYAPKTGLKLITQNSVPRGSGLGASSSLLMALSAALVKLKGRKKLNLKQIIDWGANLEAQSLRTLTGKQDYYAAIYGGIQALWFTVKGVRSEPLKLSADFLRYFQKALILSFTGISHFSGLTNWNMVKAYLEGEKPSLRHISRIKEIALDMRQALLSENLEKVAQTLNIEWEHRKNLAAGVSTPEIEKLMQAGREAGALGHKICGAGGGGCMITLVPPKKRKQVEGALLQAGGKILNFSLDFKGLEVKEE
jgi:D-glycero-alpha-D-manno-heptose-7-phosphate kinase